MRTKFLLAMLLLLPVFTPVISAEGDGIVSEGIGLGANDAEALLAAKRDAVEKGIGVILLSQTEIENFQLKRDQVITKTMGAIKSFEILEKSTEADGLISTRIEAVLSKSTMNEDLAAFQILLESMDKPKVMVLVKESNVGNDQPTNRASENAIITFLKDPYGFELIDPSVAQSIRSSEEKMAQIAGDPSAAAAIGAQHGAEVIITGDGVGRVAEGLSHNLGGMKSVQADVTLRAINCTSGRIIATGIGHGAKVHISPNTAGTQALSQAAQKATKKLLDAIMKDWNDQINNGVPLAVSIKGVHSFRTKSDVIQTLQQIPGVAAIRERGWDSQSQILSADIQYKGNADGFCLKTDGFKMGQGGGSFMITGVKGMRVSISLQAN